MGKGSLRQEPEAIVVYLFLQGPNWSHHCSLWFGTLAGSHCNADKCTLSFWTASLRREPLWSGSLRLVVRPLVPGERPPA